MTFLKGRAGVEGRQGDPDGTGEPRGVVEADLAFEMVDFFAEHRHIIGLGLAASPGEVSFKKYYRITAGDTAVIEPEHALEFRGARVVCDGKLQRLGCDGIVPITNPLLPSAEGRLVLGVKGPTDAPSKALATCTCGTEFMVYADATVGAANEAYLVVVRLAQPAAARVGIVPFFEADAVDLIRL
jgi:hypothetical protein